MSYAVILIHLALLLTAHHGNCRRTTFGNSFFNQGNSQTHSSLVDSRQPQSWNNRPVSNGWGSMNENQKQTSGTYQESSGNQWSSGGFEAKTEGYSSQWGGNSNWQSEQGSANSGNLWGTNMERKPSAGLANNQWNNNREANQGGSSVIGNGWMSESKTERYYQDDSTKKSSDDRKKNEWSAGSNWKGSSNADESKTQGSSFSSNQWQNTGSGRKPATEGNNSPKKNRPTTEGFTQNSLSSNNQWQNSGKNPTTEGYSQGSFSSGNQWQNGGRRTTTEGFSDSLKNPTTEGYSQNSFSSGNQWQNGGSGRRTTTEAYSNFGKNPTTEGYGQNSFSSGNQWQSTGKRTTTEGYSNSPKKNGTPTTEGFGQNSFSSNNQNTNSNGWDSGNSFESGDSQNSNGQFGNQWNSGKPGNNNKRTQKPAAGSQSNKKPASNLPKEKEKKPNVNWDEIEKQNKESKLFLDLNQLWYKAGSNGKATIYKRDLEYAESEGTPDCVCLDYEDCEVKDRIGFVAEVKLDSRSSKVIECATMSKVCCAYTKLRENYEIADQNLDADPQRFCGQRISKLTLDEVTEDGLANFGDFPWILRLIYQDDDRLKCSASLVHPSIAVTTANCVLGVSPDELSVRAGEWNIGTGHERNRIQERSVRNIFIHPEFNIIDSTKDLALLFLDRKFEVSPGLNTVCLPINGHNWDNNRCIVVGWNQEEGEKQPQLRKIDLAVITQGKCRNGFNTKTDQDSFEYLFLCAHGSTQNPFLNDGGAALLCPAENSPDAYVQVGILSQLSLRSGSSATFTSLINLLDGIIR